MEKVRRESDVIFSVGGSSLENRSVDQPFFRRRRRLASENVHRFTGRCPPEKVHGQESSLHCGPSWQQLQFIVQSFSISEFVVDDPKESVTINGQSSNLYSQI
jgi:hypothetical protein